MIESIVSTLAWSAVAGYAAWRADLRIQQVIASRYPHAPKPGAAPKLSRKDVQVPDDLEAYANQWQDQWARDDTREDIRAKFLDLHTGDSVETWQKVRRAVGIGTLP